MHTLAACSTTVSCYHCTVWHFIKLNTKVVQPFNYTWSLIYKCVYKLWFSVKVTATKSVKIVLGR